MDTKERPQDRTHAGEDKHRESKGVGNTERKKKTRREKEREKKNRERGVRGTACFK